MFDANIAKKVEGGWFIAMGASEFKSGPVSELEQLNWGNFFEVRAFTKDRELKWLHGMKDARDSLEYQDDEKIKTRTEEHYLDVDLDKTKEHRKNNQIDSDEVFAIGGGTYRLPQGMTNMIEIEVYYREDNEDDKCFYQPFDFRIIGKEGP